MARPDAPPPRLLIATDLRRVPLLGVALGMAIAATVLAWIESGAFATTLVALLWLAVIAVLSSILPIANTLRLDADGFRIRSFGLFSRFVPWSAVNEIETGGGWAESHLLIALAEGTAIGRMPGLPYDPEIDRYTLVDGYGLDPEELAAEMERYRTAPHP